MDFEGITDDFVRAFLGVALPETVRRNLADAQAALRAAPARVGWVAPENLHVTLIFLGETARDALPPIAAALGEVCRGHAPFACDVRGAGHFGGRHPRVLWAGVGAHADTLCALRAALADALRGIGALHDDREYSPHVTLGRVRSSRGADELLREMSHFEHAEFGTVDVTDVVLFRSRLQHQGVQYAVLHRAALGGGAAA